MTLPNDSVQIAMERVKQVYPNAVSHYLIAPDDVWAVFTKGGSQKFSTIKKWCATEDEAWLDAASRLPSSLPEPTKHERCSCGAWICGSCLSCSSDCGCKEPEIPCDCWFHDKQVCDICQGASGPDTPEPSVSEEETAETFVDGSVNIQNMVDEVRAPNGPFETLFVNILRNWSTSKLVQLRDMLIERTPSAIREANATIASLTAERDEARANVTMLAGVIDRHEIAAAEANQIEASLTEQLRVARGEQ